MPREFKSRRRLIVLGLALLIFADVALAFYSWSLGSASHLEETLNAAMRNRDLLRADVKRAQDIRQQIPATQEDCDRFERDLFPASTGYSSVDAELAEIAGKSGLRLEGLTFHTADVKGRSVTEVLMDAAVTGSYANVVRFLNGIQRSENVYAIDDLKLNSDQARGGSGLVKVTLHLKTYFRNA